jgi:hypothetical protein
MGVDQVVCEVYVEDWVVLRHFKDSIDQGGVA